MPTALLTGPTGFLGQHLATALHAAGWNVIGIGRQPQSLISNLQSPITNYQLPIALIHAASPASVANSIIDPAADFDGSVNLLFNVLDSVRRAAPQCRVIFLSSAAVYGDPARLPVREDDPLRPISPYGFHKLLCENLLEEFWRVYQLPSISLRLFSAYGPGLKHQVLWDLCQKMIAADEIELIGAGDESRDFIHAADIGRAVLTLLDRADFQAEAYNLASGVETRIRDLAALIARALNRTPQIHFTGQPRPGDPARWQADLTRLTALGYTPQIPLATGLAEYVHWATTQASRH